MLVGGRESTDDSWQLREDKAQVRAHRIALCGAPSDCAQIASRPRSLAIVLISSASCTIHSFELRSYTTHSVPQTKHTR